MKMLVEKRAEVDVREALPPRLEGTALLTQTPLHVATWYDNEAVVKVLLKSRADPSLKDGLGYTSIHHAARQGQHEMLRLMLEEAQVQMLTMDDTVLSWYNRRHPIQLACEANCLKSFQLLLEEMEPREGTICQGESDDLTKKELKNQSQNELLKLIFQFRPHFATCLLERSEMQVVRQLLKGREKTWLCQLLVNSADWVVALDHLVKEPESLVSSLPGSPGNYSYRQKNNIAFWKLHFKNAWYGMAHLASDTDTRAVRHSPEVFYNGNDFKEKQELRKKLKGSAGEEINVSIGVIPIDVQLLNSIEVIETIGMKSKESILDTKFVKAVLDDAWNSVVLWYYCHVFWAFMNVIFICLASVYLRDGQVPATLVVLLLLIWLKRLLEETWQLRRLRPRRIAAEGDAASRWNCHAFFVFLAVNLSFHAFLDWVYLATSGCALYFLWSFEPYPLRRSLIALYFYCAWLSALYWLRGIRAWRFNEKLLPIILAMRDTGTFLLVVAFTLLASVHGYFILSIPRMPGSLYRAFEKTFRLAFLGDFDLHELEYVDTIFVEGDGALEPQDPDPTADYAFVHMFFYVVALSITIVEMNLFIGVLSSNYDKHLQQASALASRERALIIHSVRTSIWSFLWSCCVCRCGRNNDKVHPERQETGSKGSDPTVGEQIQWLFAVFQETGG